MLEKIKAVRCASQGHFAKNVSHCKAFLKIASLDTCRSVFQKKKERELFFESFFSKTRWGDIILCQLVSLEGKDFGFDKVRKLQRALMA